MKTPKAVKIIYVVEVAVFDQQFLLDAQDKLYSLLDEVFYNSAEAVTGIQMLIGSTEFRMEGQTG